MKQIFTSIAPQSSTILQSFEKDKEAKRDMMRYCGFEEYKKGKLVED